MPEVLAHAPLLLGLLLNNVNNNNPNGVYAAYAVTVVVHEQISEANYLRGMGESQDFFRFLYPCSGNFPSPFFSLFFVLRSTSPNSSFPTCSTDQPIAKRILANDSG